MINTLIKLQLTKTDVNGTRAICAPWKREAQCERRRRRSDCGTLKRQHRRRDDERAAAATTRPDGADADQGRREGTAGPIQQFDDDSSQRGGVHTELYLHFSERRAGKIVEQHDCKSGPREADLASVGREYFSV